MQLNFMKIILINIYFGSPPAYFELFLKSCGANPSFDFLFLVDFDVSWQLPLNVKLVKTTLPAINVAFQKHFDFSIALNSPYKLTDFQPAFGELLAEYVEPYDWWGHCDFDMIFGNLSPLLSFMECGKYFKVFKRGHMTLYRNTAEVNGVYKLGRGRLDYKAIFSSDKYYNFDETNGIDAIFASEGFPVFREELIADIAPKSPYLKMTAHDNYWGQWFEWSSGRLVCKSFGRREREFMYIHFQKRAMGINTAVSDKLSAIFINQFGFNGISSGGASYFLKVLSCVPNIFHLYRFYMPRIKARVLKY